MALEAKEEHAAKYPGYQYAPRRPHQRPRRRPRIHPEALGFMWKTPKGAAILEKAASSPGGDGWVPVNRDLVKELDAQHMLTGPIGLAPPPLGPTPKQFQALIRQQTGEEAPENEEEDEDDDDGQQDEAILEGLDDDFLEEILNYDNA